MRELLIRSQRGQRLFGGKIGFTLLHCFLQDGFGEIMVTYNQETMCISNLFSSTKTTETVQLVSLF